MSSLDLEQMNKLSRFAIETHNYALAKELLDLIEQVKQMYFTEHRIIATLQQKLNMLKRRNPPPVPRKVPVSRINRRRPTPAARTLFPPARSLYSDLPEYDTLIQSIRRNAPDAPRKNPSSRSRISHLY